MNKDKQAIDKILQENLYLTIAVANNSGMPWIANLFYAYDDKYTFYWYSTRDSIHSARIRNNPNVAMSIFNSRAIGNEVDACYIQAKAFELENKGEVLKGLTVYAKKLISTKFAGSKMAARFVKQYRDFQSASKLRMYKAEIGKVWRLAPSVMFKDKFIDSRVEVEMFES